MVNVIVVLFLLAVGVSRGDDDSTNRRVRIKNNSGSSLEISWINPKTNEFVPLLNVSKGSTIPLDSFVDHEFELHELPSSETGVCDASKELTCRREKFQVSDAKKQVITIEKDFSLSDKRMQEAYNEDVVQECFNEFGLAEMHASNHSTEEMIQLMHQYEECVHNGVITKLEEFDEQIKFEEELRKSMGRKLERFRCHDNDLETTEPFATEVWVPRDGIPRKAHILHRRFASEIHVIENFISPIECGAMERRAKQRGLKDATVSDGQGGGTKSDNRKALQAGIGVPWAFEKKGAPIPVLSRRVYDYVNHVLGMDIEEFGQEQLMSIQYFGRGEDDREPDNYQPHCDSDCDGQPHKHGTRVATIVMYCTVPESGGHTNFRSAGVHIKPQIGNAVFFSYIDPETKIMDSGFTEHSGCPVYVGEKKIVTQWVRYGVDKENPWSSFNTLGIQNKTKLAQIKKRKAQQGMAMGGQGMGMGGQGFCPIEDKKTSAV